MSRLVSTSNSSAGSGLYEEVLDHYRRCNSDPALLSDTWAHTLRQKGRIFEESVLRCMLELGNPANSWIDDFNYLIDGSILNLEDPITRKLLDLGEPEFGSPRRDCRVGDRWYSSNFVHHVLYAARIIRAIEERGLDHPRILEIGGGLGGVASLLRLYYGSRCTYFVVDLPEGLILQEWYLRNVFPESPSSYKAAADPCDFAEHGINFINAYALSTQPFPFDVAINIDSMQEMHEGAVLAYIRFFEANISERGLFFFQNHYGQASSSVPEPSEYPLDEHWNLALAEPAPQIECCSGSEQIRLVFHRSSTPAAPALRRLVLRTIWNGFMTGRMVSDPGLVGELVRLSRASAGTEVVRDVTDALSRRGFPLSAEEVASLDREIYPPHRSYVDLLSRGPAVPPAALPITRADALWRAQGAYLYALSRADPRELDGIPAALAQPGDVSDSPFYSAFYAAILGVLGRVDEAELLLRRSAEACPNPFWLVRSATLLDRFGRAGAARALLARVEGRGIDDFFVALKAAELTRNADDLGHLDPGANAARRLSWAKTAARLGLEDAAIREAQRLGTEGPALGSLLAILRADPGRRIHGRLAGLAPRPPEEGSEESPILYGFLLLELGRRDQALTFLQPQVRRFWDDYFRLGQMGRFFCSAGVPDLADQCLDRSIELRPGAFLHLDFVGNAYFACARYDRAAEAFRGALALKPTLRHIMAKEFYSRLPVALRESARFGKPGDLRLLFQREQDFYHDLAPSSK
jgi:putative sugar O-methyltransferase